MMETSMLTWFGKRALAICIVSAIAVIAVNAYAPEMLIEEISIGAVLTTVIVGSSFSWKQWFDMKERRQSKTKPQTFERPLTQTFEREEENPNSQANMDKRIQDYQDFLSGHKETKPEQQQTLKSYDDQVKDLLTAKIIQSIQNGTVTVKITGAIDPNKDIDPQRIKVRFKAQATSKSAPQETKPTEQTPKKETLSRRNV